MTAQIAERLRYQGEDVAMCTNPLSDFFAMGGFNPRFESNSTALWRGYVGRWEIVDGRLYLVELHGTLEDGTEASVATIFPDFPDRVFAHWYSGTIRIPQGKQLGEMMGDAPMCDQCGHITVRNGACYKCLNCGNSMGCS